MRKLTPLALTAAALLAQPAGAQIDARQASPLNAQDAANGVYVRDSAVALEKFALAQRMERLKEWDKSADVYQEILTKYAGRLVPSGTDAQNRVSRYSNVQRAVQDKLAAWPAEGRAVYVARFGPAAEAMLKQATPATGPADDALLHRVLATYFITPAAKAAGLRLAQEYFESSEFAAAAWVGRRLLDQHPDLGNDRGPLLFRTALAQHLAGNQDAADGLLAELKKTAPAAAATVAGKPETDLADALAADLKRAAPSAATAVSPDSWPMPFGAPDRDRVPPDANALGLARLYGIDLKPATPKAVPANNVAELNAQRRAAATKGVNTGILPAVDRGQLFFQNNARVYGLDLESGLPLPGWSATYPDTAGAFAIDAWSTPPGRTLAVALTDEAVLAILGQPDMIAAQLTGAAGDGEKQLACLDRATGKKLWSAKLDQLPVAPDDAGLKNLEMVGSPLPLPGVGGGRVYVLARGSKNGQFRDSYLVCFDLADGSYLWSTYLASSAITRNDFDPEDNGPNAEGGSHLAYAGGKIYACTNLGGIAAVDAYEGTIEWLSLYPRPEPQTRRRFFNNRQRFTPVGDAYKANPVIVADGKLFALPDDGTDALVLDAASGEELKRIDLQTLDPSGDPQNHDVPDTLLAVVGPRLALASDARVYLVNWPDYRAGGPPEQADKNFFGISAGYVENGETSSRSGAIRGRAFVTDGSVYTPTITGLRKIALAGAREEDIAGGAWAEGEGPGNMLVLGGERAGYLVVAGPTRVSLYTDPATIRLKLDAAVAAAPGEAGPLLKYAEVMFTSGQPGTAAEKLDAAAKLIGGESGADRRRLFDDALTFAGKLASRAGPDADALVPRLLDRAAAAADGPREQVEWRLAKAGRAAEKGQPRDVADLLQQVLDDRATREVPLPGGPAGTVAEGAIKTLTERYGNSVIDPLNARAAAALASAKSALKPTTGPTTGPASADPQPLLDVAAVYPYSPAATDALAAAADLDESAGQRREATQVLRRLSAKSLAPAQRVRVLEALARNYLAMPGRHEVALARLGKAADLAAGEKLDRPLLLPDGATLDGETIGAAYAALKARQTQLAEAALPHLRLPPSVLQGGDPMAESFADPVTIAPDAGALLPRRGGLARNDRVVTFSVGTGARQGLTVWPAGETSPRSVAKLPFEPQAVAWTDAGLLAWGEGGAALVDDDRSPGKLLWTFDPADLPAAEENPAAPGVAAKSPADKLPELGGAVAGIGGVDNGVARVEMNELRNLPPEVRNQVMQIRRQQRQQGRQVRRVVVNGRMVNVNVAVRANADANADAAGEAGELRVADVVPTTDRAVLATGDGRLAALDLETGRVVWQRVAADRAPVRLFATDVFVVAHYAGTGAARTLALDALDGRPRLTRDFPAGSPAPSNLTLAPDGTLVWLLPDKVSVKDLFDADEKVTREQTVRGRAGIPPFQFAGAEDQLVVTDGTILAVSDVMPEGPSPTQRVLAFRLADATPLKVRAPQLNKEIDVEFNPGAPKDSPAVGLRAVGSRFYVVGPKSLVGYDLHRPGDMWSKFADPSWDGREAFVAVASENVLLVDVPAGAADNAADNGGADRPPTSSMARVETFTRDRLPDGTESGNGRQWKDVTDRAGIDLRHWQAADGGLYYASADGALHLLPGAAAK